MGNVFFSCGGREETYKTMKLCIKGKNTLESDINIKGKYFRNNILYF